MDTIVAVISSQGIIQGRVDTNLEILVEEGFLILQKIKTELTPTQARTVATTQAQQQQKNVTTEEIAAYTDGPCLVLLLRRKDALHTLQTNQPRLDFFYSSPTLWCSIRDQSLFFPSETQVERVLVVIKPEYTQEQYTQIMETFENHDYVLLGKTARILGQEVTTRLFRTDLTEDIAYLTSDVSISLIFERMNAIIHTILLCGPSSPEEAKTYAPETIRSRYGKDKIHNCIYTSENIVQAKQDANLLFPAPFPIERTLALIKPDLYAQADTIIDVIKQHGFTIIAKDTFTHSKQRIEQLYHEHADKPYYPELLTYLSSGPCIAMILCKVAAIDTWKKLLGPTSPDVARQMKPHTLRARLGYDVIHNGLHGSLNEYIAEQEIQAYFPMIPVEHIPNSNEVESLLNAKGQARPFAAPQKSLNDVLVDGLTQLCRVKPIGTDAITWLADWLLRNNPYKPQVEEPEEVKPIVSVTSQLSANNAGAGISIVWLIGAPGVGKRQLSTSLAKQYGYECIHVSDILTSAIKSNSTYSDIIREYQTNERIIPTHITIQLLKTAIITSGKNKILISAFPLTLDECFAFEKEIGYVHRIVYVDTDIDTLVQHEYNKQQTEVKTTNGIDRDLIHKRISSYNENIIPVIDHYRLFKKISTIKMNESNTNELQKIFV